VRGPHSPINHHWPAQYGNAKQAASMPKARRTRTSRLPPTDCPPLIPPPQTPDNKETPGVSSEIRIRRTQKTPLVLVLSPPWRTVLVLVLEKSPPPLRAFLRGFAASREPNRLQPHHPPPHSRKIRKLPESGKLLVARNQQTDRLLPITRPSPGSRRPRLCLNLISLTAIPRNQHRLRPPFPLHCPSQDA